MLTGFSLAHSGHGLRNYRIAKADTLLLRPDDDPDSLNFLDSLKAVDPRDAAAAITYAKFGAYRSAVPLAPSKVPPYAAVMDPELMPFVESEKTADAMINSIPDPLLVKKIFLVDGLLKTANAFSDRSEYGLQDSLYGKPIRRGIKYAWGSKDFTVKYNPLKGTLHTLKPSSCDQNITGLDCSGFVYQLFITNKINVRAANADEFRTEAFLTKYLKPYFNNSPRFSIKEYVDPEISSIQPGDIVYLYSGLPGTKSFLAYHIGIAVPDGHDIQFFCSSGDRNSCDYNVSDQGGVKSVRITDYLIKHHHFGVTRLLLGPK